MKAFRLLVTGSRDWPIEDAYWVHYYLDVAFVQCANAGVEKLVIVHGACPTGVDRYADEWCEQVGCHVERHPAEWWRYQRQAGFKRNEAMVKTKPQICLALIKDHSPGATMCARFARQMMIPTEVYRYETTCL